MKKKLGKKKKKKLLVLLILSFLGLVIFFSLIFFQKFMLFIQAQPTMHQFYGKVNYVNGNPVDDGILIEAKINNEVKASQNIKNSRYGYNPFFIIEDVENNDKIEFYVNRTKSTEYIFNNFELTELNLTFDVCGDNYCARERFETCSSCSEDCGVCSTGEGGSSGSTGSSSGEGLPPQQKQENKSITGKAVEETKEKTKEQEKEEPEETKPKKTVTGLTISETEKTKNIFLIILTSAIAILAIIVFIISIKRK